MSKSRQKSKLQQLTPQKEPKKDFDISARVFEATDVSHAQFDEKEEKEEKKEKKEDIRDIIEQRKQVEKHREVEKIARKMGLEVKSFGTDLDKSLWLACKNNNFDAASLAIENGANPNYKPPKDFSALDYAVKNANSNLAFLLIDRANADFKNSLLFTRNYEIKSKVLLQAFRNADEELPDYINELLQLGADPKFNQPTQISNVCLTIAINKKSLFYVYMLAERGVKISPAEFYEIMEIEKNNSSEKNSMLFKKIKQIYKAPLKDNKRKIIYHSPGMQLFAKSTPMSAELFDKIMIDPVNHIKNTFYFKNMKNRLLLLNAIEAVSTESNNIMLPLIQLVALAASGHHANSNNTKPFKTVITANEQVDSLAIGGDSALGLYKNKNTVFIGSVSGGVNIRLSKNIPLDDNALIPHTLYLYLEDDKLRFIIKDELDKISQGEIMPDEETIDTETINFVKSLFSEDKLSVTDSYTSDDNFYSQDRNIVETLFDYVLNKGYKNNLTHQVGIILHEWKHFCDNELFGSSLTTFIQADKDRFEQIMEITEKRINLYNPGEDKLLGEIKITFQNALGPLYHGTLKGPELLARVPEVLGHLGIKKGYEWLQTNTPELLDFYENTYNKYINDYLASQKIIFTSTVQQAIPKV